MYVCMKWVPASKRVSITYTVIMPNFWNAPIQLTIFNKNARIRYIVVVASLNLLRMGRDHVFLLLLLFLLLLRTDPFCCVPLFCMLSFVLFDLCIRIFLFFILFLLFKRIPSGLCISLYIYIIYGG